MGESISEAIIGEILIASGSNVKADDAILEIETDKVNQVLYAPQAGVLTLKVNQGDKVSIGQVIGDISSNGKEEGREQQPKPTVQQEPVRAKEVREPLKPAVHGEEIRKTKENFLEDLKQKEETTPRLKEKVKSEPVIQKSPRGNETRRKMSNIRKVIAKRLVEAQQTTAMLTTFNEIDMSHVMDLREHYKEAFIKKYGVKLGFMSFFVKATVSALEAFPDLNSYIDGDDIVHREYYDIGIAVGTEKGLIVPVIRGCDKLSYAGIEQAIDSYAKKAKEGKLLVDDLQGGGFTITNGGVYGSLLSTPILNPPQSGILGMHKIEKRPVVVDDQIVIRPMMYIALSYDHRIVDGKEAVSFLVHLKNMLEDPSRLLIEV